LRGSDDDRRRWPAGGSSARHRAAGRCEACRVCRYGDGRYGYLGDLPPILRATPRDRLYSASVRREVPLYLPMARLSWRAMFTGIITDLGHVRAVTRGSMTRLEIETRYSMESIPIGASIACSGACLSVVERGPDWFAVEASAETLSKTTLGDWRVGSAVNLERPLKLGDELGGHLVLGHVDDVGTLVERTSDQGSIRLTFEAPGDLARFIAPKGSVAIDGVSMTVNEVAGRRFGVNVIPITQRETNLGRLAVGDRVNLEIDMMARYVARLMTKDVE